MNLPYIIQHQQVLVYSQFYFIYIPPNTSTNLCLSSDYFKTNPRKYIISCINISLYISVSAINHLYNKPPQNIVGGNNSYLLNNNHFCNLGWAQLGLFFLMVSPLVIHAAAVIQQLEQDGWVQDDLTHVLTASGNSLSLSIILLV